MSTRQTRENKSKGREKERKKERSILLLSYAYTQTHTLIFLSNLFFLSRVWNTTGLNTSTKIARPKRVAFYGCNRIPCTTGFFIIVSFFSSPTCTRHLLSAIQTYREPVYNPLSTVANTREARSAVPTKRILLVFRLFFFERAWKGSRHRRATNARTRAPVSR